MENTAVVFESTAKLIGIDKISVMAECHASLDMLDDNRLGVASVGNTACRIADMTDRNIASAEAVQLFFIENFVNKPQISVVTENAVVIDGNAGRLLSSVLQGKQRVVSGERQVLFYRRPDTEYAALFSNFLHKLFLSAGYAFPEYFCIISHKGRMLQKIFGGSAVFPVTLDYPASP